MDHTSFTHVKGFEPINAQVDLTGFIPELDPNDFQQVAHFVQSLELDACVECGEIGEKIDGKLRCRVCNSDYF